MKRLPSAVAAERRRYGMPHWVVFDEAHEPAWLDINGVIATGLTD